MKASLKGVLVLVTRPAAQADHLCNLIEQHGGQALRFPTLEIQPVSVNPETIAKALASDWLIFTSANAVNFALPAFGGKMPHLKLPRLAAIGQATARALETAGLRVDCQPEHEFSSEGLLNEPCMQEVVGRRITIVRGLGGREKLTQTLRERGAELIHLEVYRRNRPSSDPSELYAQLTKGHWVASTVTSGEALQNLLAMLDEISSQLLRKRPLVVVSDRIAQMARQLGFEKITVSRQPTDAAILETLMMLFCGENSGRSN